MSITYAREDDLGVDDYLTVLGASGLAARRPADDRDRVAAILAGSDLIVTARDETGRLLGLTRSITDFAISCYCADLAVNRDWQGEGIGTALLRATKELLGDGVTLVLIAAPDAEGYYKRAGPRAGLVRNPNCFEITRSH